MFIIKTERAVFDGSLADVRARGLLERAARRTGRERSRGNACADVVIVRVGT